MELCEVFLSVSFFAWKAQKFPPVIHEKELGWNWWKELNHQIFLKQILPERSNKEDQTITTKCQKCIEMETINVVVIKLLSSPCKQWSSTDTTGLLSTFCWCCMMPRHQMLIHRVEDNSKPAFCCIWTAAVKEESNRHGKKH